MKQKKVKFLMGMVLSSFLVLQGGLLPVHASQPFSMIKGADNDSQIFDENGFRIRWGVLCSFDTSGTNFTGDAKEIIIPYGTVTQIGGRIPNDPYPLYPGFNNDYGHQIELVEIPPTVNEFGEGCFMNCSFLHTITFDKPRSYDNPQDLILDASVFEGCSSLKEIDLSNLGREVKIVGIRVFANCTSLESVTLSKGMTSIPSEMFLGCTSLKKLDIPNNVTFIGENAFEGMSDFTLNCEKDSPAHDAIKKYMEDHPNQDIKIHFSNLKDEVIRLGMKLDNNTLVCYLGEDDFYLSVSRRGDGALTYISDDRSVVDVDGNGYVSIYGVGMSKVTIYSPVTEKYNEAEFTFYIVVKEEGAEPDDPFVNPDDPSSDNSNNGNDSNNGNSSGSISYHPGNVQKTGIQKIEVTYGDAPFKIDAEADNGDTVLYSSSNEKVFLVDSNGLITIRGYGSAELLMSSSGTIKNVEIIVKPIKNKITSLTVDKRNINVKWKRDKKADGYYIYYSTNAKFNKNVKEVMISKNKTTSKKIKNLKSGKKYYFKICSYKRSGDKIIKGDCSDIMKIKL